MSSSHLGWLGIARLGLVQAALGAIVVLTTSTINRVMIVELALPAMVPGLFVTWHYALQVLRPSWGHGSDKGGRRTPWIIAGMAALAVGGFGAAVSVHLMAQNMVLGAIAATIAFTFIGGGVGAAGTNLLVLLAKRVAEGRRAAAATIVWIMMIVGFIITAALAGKFLDPFSTTRLMTVAGVICATAFLMTCAALWRVEGQGGEVQEQQDKPKVPFAQAIAEVWADATARRFAIFIFVSMLAYSAQDLILEPFAGLVFGLTPGQSTSLSGVQNSGRAAGHDPRRCRLDTLPPPHGAEELDGHRLHRLGAGPGRPRRRGTGGAGLALEALGVLPRLLQRPLRGRGHRLHVQHGEQRRQVARGRAHGSVRGIAGHRLRHRRLCRHHTGGCLAPRARLTGHGLCHGLRRRGVVVPRCCGACCGGGQA